MKYQRFGDMILTDKIETIRPLRVLVACEYSGRVRDAFAKLGHDATSCDLLPTESAGKHYTGNVFDIINDGWDLMIAHPPCTYLSYAGIGWFNEEKYGEKARERKVKRDEAMRFFEQLYAAPIKKICIENPVGWANSHFRKPDQIIQPFHFGDNFIKRTCLWTRGLPKLVYSESDNLFEQKNTVDPEYYFISSGSNYRSNKMSVGKEKRDQKERSITFPGIANAMAEQWGGKVTFT